MGARFLLAALLALHGVLALLPSATPLSGDEVYYVAKARALRADHAFPIATARDLAIERGEIWGTGDWRPPGYPLVLAALAWGSFDTATLRTRATVLQFVLLAAALWFLLETLLPFASARWWPLAVAAMIGGTPWPFAFVRLMGPDSLNASLFLIGVLLLWRRRFFTGTMLAAVTILLRPEMLALAPVVAGAAWLMSPRRVGTALRCAAALAIVVAVQFAYRVHFIGGFTLNPFGGLHIADRGAFEWVHTWIGTEKEAYEFVYGLTNGRLTSALPDRAFSNDAERNEVLRIVEQVRIRGYAEDADAAFADLARQRRRASPLSAIVVPRIWRAAHLWLNLETNEQLLFALAHVPRPPRRAILGALLAAKVALLFAFLFAVVRVVRVGPSDALARLVFLMALVVIGRTVLVGLVLDWMAHRYVLVAWPHLIGCVAAAFALRTARASLHGA